jgi:hypothetical protein
VRGRVCIEQQQKHRLCGLWLLTQNATKENQQHNLKEHSF